MNQLFEMRDIKQRLLLILNNLSQTLWANRLLILTITVPVIWCLFTFDKLFVMSEGWYTTYAQMIINGKVPYIDFEYCLPPVYLYLITGIVAIFGSDIIVLRLFGVVIFALLTFVTYRILSNVFPEWISALCSLVMIFVMQSENASVTYDYIRIFDLLNICSLLFFINYLKSSDKKIVTLVGILVSFAFLVRQSSGLIIAFYYLLILLIVPLLNREWFKLKSIAYYLLGFITPVLILLLTLLCFGALNNFIEMCFLSGAKGSFLDMLYGWIIRLYENDLQTIVFAFQFSLMLVVLVHKDNIKKSANHAHCLLIVSIFALIIMVCIAMMMFNYQLAVKLNSYWHSQVVSFFAVNLVLFIMLFTQLLYKDKSSYLHVLLMVLISGHIIATSFGSGTSGGLSLGQGALNYAFVLGFIMNLISNLEKRKIKAFVNIMIIGLIAVLVMTSVAVKVVTPYQWWGITANTYGSAEESTSVAPFSGLYLTIDEKNLYEDFNIECETSLGDNDLLYCYSQIPIFYTIANKTPFVQAVVPWFDVSRESTISLDLENLKNTLPKMIVFADHGQAVLTAHEQLFGDMPNHTLLYNWLNDCKNGANGYTVIMSKQVDNYPIYIMVR